MFGEDAAGYDAARPTYPDALVDRLVELVGPGARVIDVGTGTGKATRLLADRGMVGVGVEAHADMAAVARRHLAGHPGWRVDVADFEWWRPEPGDAPADLVTSAQAWHWVHPQVGLWRAHRLLRPDGWMAVFWNLADDRDDRPVRRAIDDVYARHAPGDHFCPTIQRDEGSPFAPTLPDAVFVGARTELFHWRQRYTTDELLALLATHSNHRVMPPERRERVLRGVAEVVDADGGTFDYPYITRLWVAHRA